MQPCLQEKKIALAKCAENLGNFLQPWNFLNCVTMGLSDIIIKVLEDVNKYNKALCELQEYIKRSKSTRCQSIHHLKDRLKEVKSALSRFINKSDVLICLVNDKKDWVTTVVQTGDHAQFNAFLQKAMPLIDLILEAYQEFIKIYGSFSDSLEKELDQCSQHLTIASSKKENAVSSGITFTILFGGIALLGFGGFGIVAWLGYTATLATAAKVCIGLGIATCGTGAVLTAKRYYSAYSDFTEMQKQLETLQIELNEIVNASSQLSSKSSDLHNAVQDCRAEVEISLTCEERDHHKTLANILYITEDIKTKCINVDEQRKIKHE